MRHASIGSLEVSVVGLGCNNFGRMLDASHSARVVRAALDAGITYFDTADSYGEGGSERYLGRALGRRIDDVVIATKFGRPTPDVGGEGGARPEYVRSALRHSLGRLGREHVDLYQLHIPDPATPIDDTLGALEELRDQGLIREIGVSNLDAQALEEADDAAVARGTHPFVSNQVEYSLAHRDPERNGLVSVCTARGVALLPYYPLASGSLTGKAAGGPPTEGRLTTDRYRRFLAERYLLLADRVSSFARERDLTPVQVAIGWLLSRDVVPSVTPGATTPAQVAANAAASAWSPTGEDLATLDAITPA